MNRYEYIIDKPQKLTDFLYSLSLKSSQISKLFKLRDVKVDGRRVSEDILLEQNQKIVFFMNENISKRFQIFYEDENVIIVNKFQGIEVVGENGLEGELKAFPVHRIDRNTKGLVILAKNKSSEEELLKAFKEKNVVKKYICEVIGDTAFKNELKKAYLFKDASKSIVYVYDEIRPHSSQILTRFNTLKHGNETSIVECELLTGKTHQIRAHLKHLGHPIIGDGKYGNNEDNKKFKESTQKLYCYYLKFINQNGILKNINNKEFILFPNWFKKEK